MKLALAIVVCSGVYLCAVSATRGKLRKGYTNFLHDNEETEKLLEDGYENSLHDPEIRKQFSGNEDGYENFLHDHKIWEHFFGDYIELEPFPNNNEEYEVLSNRDQEFDMFLGHETAIEIHLGNEAPKSSQFDKDKFLNEDPSYKDFIRMYPGYENYVAFKQFFVGYLEFNKFFVEYRGYKLFIENPRKYIMFLELKDPRYARFPKREDGFKFFFDYLQVFKNIDNSKRGFEKFVEIVSKRYEQFVTNSKLGLSPEHRGVHPLRKYNLKKESFHYLYEADLDFKCECIGAYQARFAFNPKELGWHLKNDKIYVAAYSVLEEQIGEFIEDLKKTGIDDESKAELIRHAQICNNFLELFGFWFAPKCDPSALRTEIVYMKKELLMKNKGKAAKESSEDIDKAAKVMVMLKLFAGDKENVQYPKV